MHVHQQQLLPVQWLGLVEDAPHVPRQVILLVDQLNDVLLLDFQICMLLSKPT